MENNDDDTNNNQNNSEFLKHLEKWHLETNKLRSRPCRQSKLDKFRCFKYSINGKGAEISNFGGSGDNNKSNYKAKK